MPAAPPSANTAAPTAPRPLIGCIGPAPSMSIAAEEPPKTSTPHNAAPIPATAHTARNHPTTGLRTDEDDTIPNNTGVYQTSLRGELAQPTDGRSNVAQAHRPRLALVGGSDAGISAALRAQLDPSTDVTVVIQATQR